MGSARRVGLLVGAVTAVAALLIGLGLVLVPRQPPVIERGITYFLDQRAFAVALEGEYLWVTHEIYSRYPSVWKIRAQDGRPVASYETGTAILFDGSHILVANSGDDTVSKLRPPDGKVLGTYPVGTLPTNLLSDGTHIWAADYARNTVSKVRPSDGAVAGTYSVG